MIALNAFLIAPSCCMILGWKSWVFFLNPVILVCLIFLTVPAEVWLIKLQEKIRFLHFFKLKLMGLLSYSLDFATVWLLDKKMSGHSHTLTPRHSSPPTTSSLHQSTISALTNPLSPSPLPCHHHTSRRCLALSPPAEHFRSAFNN